MKFSKLRPLVVLIAAMVVSIDNIVSRRPVTKSLLILLATIVGFYIITTFAIKIINKAIDSAPPIKEDDGESLFNEDEEEDENAENSEGSEEESGS